jgi:hypothetical protein
VSANVEHTLARLGLEYERKGDRLWLEWCPLPTHPNHNPAHRWSNCFVRAGGTEKAGLWACFSCAGGGRLHELVMQVLGLDFRGAMEWFRGVDDAPPRAPVVSVRHVPLSGVRRVFTMPEGAEYGPLARWNSVAREYAESRGLSAWQVERWGIGYSLMGRLAGRIVFPIVDSCGRLANYAARTFVGGEVRYLAASEREHPDLAAMLGERYWPPVAERGRATVVVFEGALSGMAIERALARAGRRAHIAGLQGSAEVDRSPRRAERLAGFGRWVSACDPDAAGEKASFALASALRRTDGMRLRYPSERDAADTPIDELAAALAECLPAEPGFRGKERGIG